MSDEEQPEQEPPAGGREPWTPPPYQAATWSVLGAAALLGVVLFLLQGDFHPDRGREYPGRMLPPEPEPVLLAAPEIDDEYLPCADCHERGDIAELEVRELEDEHDEMDFAHGDLWCYSCHDPDAEHREELRLSNGTHVAFEDSWKLCTQCHGKKLADWRAGVHGKRTGHWWGPKEYRTCVVCHDPHHPPFQPIEPMPPPRRPEAIASKEPHDEAS
jgi:hypothetical protein